MSDKQLNSLLEFYLCGCAILVCSVLGILGNITIIFMLKCRKMKMNPTFTNLIAWLAVINSLFLVFVTLSFSLPSLSPRYKERIFPLILPSLLPLTSVTLSGSVYCVVALCIERYLQLTRPQASNKGSFFGYILPVLAFSVLYNGPKFFEFTTEYTVNGQRELEPYIRATEFRMNSDYGLYILGSNFIFMGILPFTLLISLNWLISQRVKHYFTSEEITDQPVSLLLSCIVVVQLVCHAPRTGLNIFEIYQSLTGGDMTLAQPWIVDLSHLMLAISSASNVLIFTLQDLRFRSLLMRDLKKVLFLYSHRNRGVEVGIQDRPIVHGLEDRLLREGVGERLALEDLGEGGRERVTERGL